MAVSRHSCGRDARLIAFFDRDRPMVSKAVLQQARTMYDCHGEHAITMEMLDIMPPVDPHA